ncbi:MAG: hypothetical protein Q9183_007757 [Haloplaca sp. 2 TL-2023]
MPTIALLSNSNAVQLANTTVRSAELNAKKTTAILCDKYIGSAQSISIEEWLDVFNAVTIDYSDRDEIRSLPRHISMSWFSLEIVPELQTISWTECQHRMIARFGQEIANPIVEATHRRLTFRETVSQYFNEKRRLLIKAGAPIPIQVALLNSGMPDAYQQIIGAQLPKTPNEWLKIALQLEQSRNKRIVKPTESAFLADDDDLLLVKTHMKSRNSSSDKPPTPCPHCSRLGYPNEMHWKRTCPRRQSTENVCQGQIKTDTAEPTNDSNVLSIDYVYTDVKVNNKTFKPFIDTGAKITCLSIAGARRAGLTPSPRTSIGIRRRWHDLHSDPFKRSSRSKTNRCHSLFTFYPTSPMRCSSDWTLVEPSN